MRSIARAPTAVVRCVRAEYTDSLAANPQGLNSIVTGASRGLGAAIATELHRRGVNLLLVARCADSLEERRRELLALGSSAATIHTCAADLVDPRSPGRIIEEARRQWSRLDALVNNAAIQGPIGNLWDNDWGEWNRAIQVNLLAPVALCRLAVPWMRESGGGSIVNLSGGGATGPRPRFTAYATAKAGLVRFSETLARETAASGIRVNSVAPGAMDTRMLDEVLAAGPDSTGEEEYARAVERRAKGGAAPKQAAELIALLVSPESSGITGRLLSAVWDPWRELPAKAGEIRDTDLYTLRRVVPASGDAP